MKVRSRRRERPQFWQGKTGKSKGMRRNEEKDVFKQSEENRLP